LSQAPIGVSSTSRHHDAFYSPILPGIGRALVAVYLSRPNSIVVAAVRDPSTDTSRSLTSLPKHETSKLIIVKLDSSSDSDAVAAVETLVCVDSISHLDVVVANAGIFEAPGPTDQLRIEDVRKHIDVNGIAPLLLFQATEGLMRKAEKQPKFVLVGAALASLTQMEHFATQPWVAYGASKTLANYFVRKMHFENDWLIAFTIHPG